MLLTAAAVWARGVVLTFTSQLPFVEHAAVGVQVALAPETKAQGQKAHINAHPPAPVESIPFEEEMQSALAAKSIYVFQHVLTAKMEILAGYLTWITPPQSFIMLSSKNTRPHLSQSPWREERCGQAPFTTLRTK